MPLTPLLLQSTSSPLGTAHMHTLSQEANKASMSFHRSTDGPVFRLLVCSDGSDMKAAAPRLLYIYSRRRDSKTSYYWALLRVTERLWPIERRLRVKKNPTYCVSYVLTVSRPELINMLSVSCSCLFSQPPLRRSFFQA